MTTAGFVPHHLNATPSDLAGNDGIGRYVILPGSDGRAKQIAEHFEDVRVLPHPRCHNLYLGRLRVGARLVDVASVSTGMGCASLDIIVNELCGLGAKRFVRVGTAGSLQPANIRAGSLVVATASVRDEATSRRYVPIEVPAVASLEVVLAAKRAAAELGLAPSTHFGVVHCKDSLFAREFGAGPLSEENHAYMRVLSASGVLASEMETAQLFILAALQDHRLRRAAEGHAHRVLAGAVLGVVGDDRPFATPEEERRAVDGSVALVLETIRQLAAEELGAGLPEREPAWQEAAR
ncbi:MAG TPA: nucleoside phosphorylase [Pantanalinema sp.]